MAKTLLTKTQFKNHDNTLDPRSTLRNPWTVNWRISAIFALSQESLQGLAALWKTKTVDFLHGKVYQALQQIKTKCQPSDLTAEVELEEELENVKFHNASDYYKSFVTIQSKYDAIILETDQVKLLAKKCNSQTFLKMIMDHLNDTNIPNSLETTCSDIGKIQRLTKTGSGR